MLVKNKRYENSSYSLNNSYLCLGNHLALAEIPGEQKGQVEILILDALKILNKQPRNIMKLLYYITKNLQMLIHIKMKKRAIYLSEKELGYLQHILYNFSDYMAHDDRPDHGLGILKGYRDMPDEEKHIIFYLAGRLRRLSNKKVTK
jgi:hypothetical protein